MKVYLAGGMCGDWRQTVKEAVPSLQYLDPTEHRLLAPADYTAWDLLAVAQSDVVFCYLAENNPSGIGLAVELGYGKALGKLTILVDEQYTRYTAILRNAADVCYVSLGLGVAFLKTLMLFSDA